MALVITHDYVVKKLHETFPDPNDAHEALVALQRYGDREWHINQDLVHLAIIKLSEGKLWQLRDNVQVARKEYRDVLFAAMQPESRKRIHQFQLSRWNGGRLESLSPKAEAAMKKRDGAQWRRWLAESGP